MIFSRIAARWTCCKTGYSQNHKRRSHYATSAGSPERIELPTRSNGQITLDVYHPLQASATGSGVVIYLPRGPCMRDDEQESRIVTTITSSLRSSYAVRINYRLSEGYKFPTPVHDTVAGFDWVLDNLLSKRSGNRTGRADRVVNVAVCGELIGGGLATALALTECRVGEPGIIAAAVNNPLVDWVSLNATVRPKEVRKINVTATRNASNSESIHSRLVSLRKQLFANPGSYFDPFASSVLFFRSAGVEVPPSVQEMHIDDLAQLSLLEREEVERQQLTLSTPEALDHPVQVQTSLPIRRKASRRFPSKALGLRLPSFKVSAGTVQPFQAQASEITQLLRQSVIRQSQDRSGENGFGHKVLLGGEANEYDDDEQRSANAAWKAHAEEKIQSQRNESLALWDGSLEGHARLMETTLWLKAHLE